MPAARAQDGGAHRQSEIGGKGGCPGVRVQVRGTSRALRSFLVNLDHLPPRHLPRTRDHPFSTIMSTSSSSSSALLSYLPTILLLPVAYGLWKFSSPPPSSTSSSSEPSTTAGKASKKKKKKTTPAAAKEEQPPVMEEKKRVQQQPAPKVQEKAAPPPPAPTVAEVVKNGKGKKKSNKLKALAAAEEGKGKPLAEVHAEREAKRQGKSGVEE